MTLTDATVDVQQRLEPARERVSEVYEQAREATEPARQRVVEAATRAAEAAAPRVEQAREGARPAAGRLKEAAVEGGAVAASVVERLVAVLQALFGNLEEKGRELAHQVEPPASVTRRSRWRLAAWFTGGFAVGVGAGWYAHQRFADQGIEGAQDPGSHARDVAGDRAPYADDAAAIDASRENVSFN